MRRLVRYLKPYRGAVAVSLFFLLLQSVTQIAGPLLDQARRRSLSHQARHARPLGSSTPGSRPILWTGLAQISALYFASLLIGFACEFVETYLMQRTGQLAMFDLRRQLMERLQTLDVAYYDRNPVGRLITRVTTDVDALNELWASGLVTILGDVLVLSFVVLVMFRLSPGMTALLLAVLPVVVLVTAVFRRTVQQSYRRIRVAVARINSYLQEHVNGMAVLPQAFQSRGNWQPRQEFAAINRDDHAADLQGSRSSAYGWFYPVVEFHGACCRSPCCSPTEATATGRASCTFARRADSVLPIRPAVIPPPFRTSAKNTTSCNPRWPPVNAFSNCSTRRRESHRPLRAARVSRKARWPSSSTTSWFRLSRRRLGPPRRQFPHRAGRNHRRRRTYWRGQNDAHESPPALLRHPARPHPRGRPDRIRRAARTLSRRSPPPFWSRSAGSVPVHRHSPDSNISAWGPPRSASERWRKPSAQVNLSRISGNPCRRNSQEPVQASAATDSPPARKQLISFCPERWRTILAS